MRPLVRTPKSSFVKIVCKKCKNEQIVFNKSSTLVKCLKCGSKLAEPTGGIVKFVNSKIVRQLG